MGRKRYSEEEILRILREAASGETVVEVCRKHGISQQSFYFWKKYAGLALSELRELRLPPLRGGRIDRTNQAPQGESAAAARREGPAVRRNEKWSTDFVARRLSYGRWIRVLTVGDQYTRECLTLHADT